MRKESFTLKILEEPPYDKYSKISMEAIIIVMNKLKLELHKQGYLYLREGRVKDIKTVDSKTKS